MNATRKPIYDLCLATLPVVVEDKDGDRYTVTGLRWTGRICYCVCEGQDWELRACHVRKIGSPQQSQDEKERTMTTENTIDFELIFDNGGGITLQSADYVHWYNDPAQAATDVKAILENNCTSGWEGHEPESRIEYEYDSVRNGGYRWMNRADLESAMSASEVVDSGRAFDEFFAALRK